MMAPHSVAELQTDNSESHHDLWYPFAAFNSPFREKGVEADLVENGFVYKGSLLNDFLTEQLISNSLPDTLNMDIHRWAGGTPDVKLAFALGKRDEFLPYEYMLLVPKAQERNVGYRHIANPRRSTALLLHVATDSGHPRLWPINLTTTSSVLTGVPRRLLDLPFNVILTASETGDLRFSIIRSESGSAIDNKPTQRLIVASVGEPSVRHRIRTDLERRAIRFAQAFGYMLQHE